MRSDHIERAGTTCFRSSATMVVLAVLLVPWSLQAQEPPQAAINAVKGRLVVGDKGDVSDWRILAAQRISAELPRDAAGLATGVTPEPDGTFALELPAAAPMYLCPYVGGTLAAADVIPIQVTPGEALPEGVTLTPKPPRDRVEFVLQREDGQPLGRRVRAHLYNLYGEVGASGGGTWSGETGVISYDRLPCARYDLWIEGPAKDAAPGGGDLPASLFRGLEVAPGEGTQTIELTVPQPGAVRGLLVRADGKTPAPECVVAVQTGTVPDEGSDAEAWAAAYAHGALGCYAEAEVGADGTFLLGGLTPGKHALDVRRPGEREAWCTIPDVEVKPNGVTDLGTVPMPRNGWQYLFDRRTLDGWVESDFYGQKEVRIENDRVVLSMGNDMTGITWTKAIPRVDYEVSLQAMRVAGDDFFCGLTFPVKESYCSLILGGWGGSVVGLSSLDGADASENETSDWIQFKSQRWYRVRLRVSAGNIAVWLDQDNIADVATENREISTRIEMGPSKPFGIATWCTTGAVRDIRLRRLDAPAP